MKKVIFGLIFLMIISSAYAGYKLPGSWYGYLYIDDVPAPDGTVIQAFINDESLPSAYTTLKRGDGYFLIHVEGKEGDIVKFFVGATEIRATEWHMGVNKEQMDIYLSSDEITGDVYEIPETKNITETIPEEEIESPTGLVTGSQLGMGILILIILIAGVLYFRGKGLIKK